MAVSLFMRRIAAAFAAMLLLFGFSRVPAQAAIDSYGGRDLIVHVPSQLPPSGSRALVVVLHGGLGNADRIVSRQSETGLNMDTVADKNGFVVAYLNGTPITRRLGAKFLGWNAGGGCCGQSFENNVDDVAYIQGTVGYLVKTYGIDSARIYGTGHSNGAMMTQRLICETDLYAAVVTVSGPLNLETANCTTARGKRILAIHGADDRNVPLAGGVGPQGLSRVAYQSEAHAKTVFERSGAIYTLQIVPGADHALDHIEAVIQKSEGVSLPEKTAAFFGLTPPARP